MTNGRTDKTFPWWRTHLAQLAITQGPAEIARIYEVDEHEVRDLVVEHRAEMVRKRQGAA